MLILPWVIVTAFSGLWVLWLGVSSIALVLWWDQVVMPEHDMKLLIFTLVALFNGVFLCLREVLSARCKWLDEQWTRILLSTVVLAGVTVPGIVLIFDFDSPDIAAQVGGCIAPFILGGFYYAYHYRMHDMPVLALTTLAACALVETAAGKIMFEIFGGNLRDIPILFMGFFSIALFGSAVVWLRTVARKREETPCPST